VNRCFGTTQLISDLSIRHVWMVLMVLYNPGLFVPSVPPEWFFDLDLALDAGLDSILTFHVPFVVVNRRRSRSRSREGWRTTLHQIVPNLDGRRFKGAKLTVNNGPATACFDFFIQSYGQLTPWSGLGESSGVHRVFESRFRLTWCAD